MQKSHFGQAFVSRLKFGMDILLHPRNKPWKEFLKILDGLANGSCSKFGMDILLHPRNKPWKEFLKILDGLANGSRSMDLDKIWQEHTF